MMRRILVVDDEPLIREHLKILLSRDGHLVETAEDGKTALDALRCQQFSLLITDLRLPDLDGRELLATVQKEQIAVGVIMLTGFGDTSIALEAMHGGADDFVTKPFEPEHLLYLVRRILERRRLIDELASLRQSMRYEHSFQNMVSKNARMRKIFDLIEQVGPLGSTVLIQGETGTGKELVAQALHSADQFRRRGPWVAFNCAALTESLVETELFGHEKGAFTGAEFSTKGKFEQADGGTLFLDEIGDVSPSMQAKLLRVLESGTFEKVGGTKTRKVDCRIITASNKSLEEEVKLGRFRSDLFYRLNVVRISLPALRERIEDIPLLAEHFLEKHRGMSTPPVTDINHSAMQVLLEHSWPGNIRELENAIKAAIAMSDGTIITREALPASIAPIQASKRGRSSLIDTSKPLPELTDELVGIVERDYFSKLLRKYRGNVASCARHSGLSRRSVTQKLQKYALDRLSFRDFVDEEID